MIKIKQVYNLVSDYFEIEYLGANTRKTEIVFGRYVYFKLCDEFTTVKLESIANKVGLVSHASVLHGIKNFEDMFSQIHFKKHKEGYEHLSEVIKKIIAKEKSEKRKADKFAEKIELDVLKEIYSLKSQDIKDFEEVAKEFLDNRKKVFGLEVVF